MYCSYSFTFSMLRFKIKMEKKQSSYLNKKETIYFGGRRKGGESLLFICQDVAMETKNAHIFSHPNINKIVEQITIWHLVDYAILMPERDIIKYKGGLTPEWLSIGTDDYPGVRFCLIIQKKGKIQCWNWDHVFPDSELPFYAKPNIVPQFENDGRLFSWSCTYPHVL